LQELQLQQQTLNREQQEQAELLSQIIRASYMTDESQFLKTLLNQEDPSSAGRMMQYTRIFSSYQREQLQNY